MTNVAHINQQQNIVNILFVDDEPAILKALVRFGRSKGWKITTANSANEAMLLLESQEFDVIISDMRMPGMSGTDFLTCAKTLCPQSIRVLLTGYSDIDAVEHAINDANIHNYVTKPWDEFELTEIVNNGMRFIDSERERRRLEKLTSDQNKKLGKLALILDKQVKERTIEIEQALFLLNHSNEQVKNKLFESLTVLTHILEWKDGGDSEHSRFVATYGEKIGRYLKLSDEEIQDIKVAAMLYKVGMLNLPDSMRAKPKYSYNAEENTLSKQIPVLGEMALSSAPNMQKVAKIIRHRYEHVNGNGYPDAITDKDIPIESKIIAVVADFYDMFNGKLVHKACGTIQAKAYIEEWRGKKYDSKIIDAFWQLLTDFEDTSHKTMPVFSSDLLIGMTLESDIVTKKGILLITKNTILNESIIEKIKVHEKRYNEEFMIKVNIAEKV